MNKTIKILLLALALGPSAAAADAGKVLFTLGRVDIHRGEVSFPAARGMTVAAGDRFELGPTGRTQLRMSDGAMIALQPGSSFVIEEYQLPAAAAVPAAAAADAPAPIAAPARPVSGSGNGRALFSLLRGGFRTITGLIGKGDQDTYQLKTPVATIGIRGTTYSATYCQGGCGAAPSGLYVGVSSGKIVVSNSGGSQSYGDSQYGYVPDENSPPEETLEPPADVLDPPIEDSGEDDDSGDGGDAPGGSADAGGSGDQQTDGESGSGGDSSQQADAIGSESGDGSDSGGTSGESGSDSGSAGTTGGSNAGSGENAKFGDAGGSFDSPPPDSGGSTPPPTSPVENKPPEVPGAEPVTVPSRLAAYSARGPGGQPDNEALRNDADDINVEASGLTSFQTVLSGTAVEQYAIGSAQNVNQGFDPATSLRWGRWSGGAAQAGANSLDLAQQSLHWIVAPAVLEQPVLPISGSATYQLVGNTSPTDNAGNIGFLGSAHFSADFSAGTVSNSLSLSINNQLWTASGSANFSRVEGFPAFAGGYSSVSANGQAGTGGFAGFFTGPPGGGIPSGAGLGYSLNSGSTTVSGAAAFGNPAPTGAAP